MAANAIIPREERTRTFALQWNNLISTRASKSQYLDIENKSPSSVNLVHAQKIYSLFRSFPIFMIDCKLQTILIQTISQSSETI